MSNRVKLHCEFCFRGEYLTPTLELDLDQLMEKQGTLPDLYPLLAQSNGIGFYSYEYEMLQAESIGVEALSGWVKNFIEDNILNIPEFEKHWHNEHLQAQLIAITQKHQLAPNPTLLAALEEAFKLGTNSPNTTP